MSVVQAARTLFRTRTPSDEQVHRVFRLMKSGALAVRDASGAPLAWTTTESALADFLAENETRRAGTAQAKESSSRRTAGAAGKVAAVYPDQGDKLREVYHEIWRDYFLAVMFRRRTANRTVFFRRAVLAGQVVLLATMVVAIVTCIRGMGAWNEPPERQHVKRWIEQNTDEFSIKRWLASTPADAGGVLVEVEYRYQKESPRWVHTSRTFHVAGEAVEEVVAGD